MVLDKHRLNTNKQDAGLLRLEKAERVYLGCPTTVAGKARGAGFSCNAASLVVNLKGEVFGCHLLIGHLQRLLDLHVSGAPSRSMSLLG